MLHDLRVTVFVCSEGIALFHIKHCLLSFFAAFIKLVGENQLDARQSLTFYLFPQHLINSIRHEHSCKILCGRLRVLVVSGDENN